MGDNTDHMKNLKDILMPLPITAYVLMLAQFSAPFMVSGVGVTLPALGRDLQVSGVSLGLIETIYLGAASAFLLPVGHIADSYDKNLIFKSGLFIYAFSTLLIGFLHTVPSIVMLRFVQGVAAALVMATNVAILTSVVPKKKLGRAMGLNVGAVYVGLSAGPFVAGWITTHFGWRWVFYLTFIPMICSFMLIHFNLKVSWKKPSVSFDWIGTIMIVTSIFLLIFGSATLGESFVGYLLCFLGFTGIAVFFIVESKVKRPMLKLGEIKANHTFSIALLLQLLMYAGAFGLTFLFSLYLQTVKGMTPLEAGRILIVSPVVMAVFAPIFGRLADQFSARKIATLGLGISLISILLAVAIRGDSSIFYIVCVLMLQGLGFAIFSSPNMAIIMNSVQPRQYGLASALSAKLRSLGMVISLMIVTVFISVFIGRHMLDTRSTEFLLVMRYSFIVFAISAFLGTLLSLKTHNAPDPGAEGSS